MVAALGALSVIGLLAAFSALDAARLPIDRLDTRVPFPTALMRAREAEARRRGLSRGMDCRFVPYDRISPLLRRAVLVAEDDAFFQHGGLDWSEIGASARRNLERGRVVRGGSTITQQLARNLYLGEDRTVGRKLKEVVLALRMERSVSKRRILELYLNLIEWGDGIYGAGAAARRYFGTSAADLDARQALLLASVIINPRRFSPLEPTPRIEKRVRTIASRMLRRGQLTQAEYRLAVGEPSRGHGAVEGGAPGATPAPVGHDTPPEIETLPADGDTATGGTPEDTTGAAPGSE